MLLHDIKGIKNGRIITKDTISKTKDADYKNYYDVGRDVGLSGEKLIQYVEYMRQRWPNKENSPAELGGYCKEWARRFLKGDAWKLSDLEGQRILERMGITDSKSTKDADDIWAVVFENTVMATYPTESQARNFINRLHGTREDKQGYYVKQVDPKIKQGDRVRDSKTKDATIETYRRANISYEGDDIVAKTFKGELISRKKQSDDDKKDIEFLKRKIDNYFSTSKDSKTKDVSRSEQAYDEGYEAAKKGKTISDNPYQNVSKSGYADLKESWNDGYRDGRSGKSSKDSKTKDDYTYPEDFIQFGWNLRQNGSKLIATRGVLKYEGRPYEIVHKLKQWLTDYTLEQKYGSKDSDIIINVVEKENEEVAEEEAFDLIHYNGYNIKLVKETGEYDIYDVGGAMIGHTATLELAKLFVDNKGNATIVYE